VGAENIETQRDNVETERGSNDPNVALNDADIVVVLGLWVPIENLHPKLRDVAKKSIFFEGSLLTKRS
jgi:hypothetical protein